LVTDDTGRCLFTSSLLSKKVGSVTFTVTNVVPPSSPPGLQYDSSQNHSDGGGDGTSITISKP
jgi:hypothetical protein